MEKSQLVSDATHQSVKQYESDIEAFEGMLRTKNLIIDDQNCIPSAERVYKAVELFYESGVYKSLIKNYRFDITRATIAGVGVEIFLPSGGVPLSNKEKVLINLHGGSFQAGSRTNSHLESGPIASMGEIKVVSIDYRMAPEYRFPSASDDVLTVYKELLLDYSAENIGIFGCSAGALLSAQSIARCLKEELPLPSSIVMSCAGGYYWGVGDSGCMAESIGIYENIPYYESPYFSDAESNDPLLFPAMDIESLGKFPPALLISSTRDFALSSVVDTHRKLLNQGVKAVLHVWEGLEHAFIYNTYLQESREASLLIVEFLLSHLGQSNK